MNIKISLVIALLLLPITLMSADGLRKRWVKPEAGAQVFNDAAYEAMEEVGGAIGGAIVGGLLGAGVPLTLSCTAPVFAHPVIVGGSTVIGAGLVARYGYLDARRQARKVFELNYKTD